MEKLKFWIEAFRLRTLPLALSSAILGSFLAYANGQFSPLVFGLAISTTIFLQILSNLANDFGDSQHGTDNANRVGPERSVQSGKISKKEMKRMIVVFIILSFISGGLLIFSGIKTANAGMMILFFVLGIASIVAAIKYTVGKNPYGYSGFGDIFVFVFFGLLGVCGTFFLHTNQFEPLLLLPAASIGFLSAGVLNLNNMRDIKNDTASGKRTLVVRIGSQNAKVYHALLIILSPVLSLIYVIKTWQSVYQLMFLLSIVPLGFHLYEVFKNHVPDKLNNQLKVLALTTFFFSVSYSLGVFLVK
ncbi:1,4-dihydroxy-2-naphthoate polyprenyltransferase [Maribellus comscasis]|uniref:1,4-dihydroxy-2-naphthoate octaprenyltransferase n=1 Tax=Maribellus comscasis TaxID=2681766 RepID=A0A6I6K410_9BACT|nr:1,4-dihydroxy-2-naphthoate polyprenyltransferase [Maribellus comscasis]QGY44694.1 1,4-dihydroxy-2-naphthoate polyprenyltransferase [Maribellus comscasis]